MMRNEPKTDDGWKWYENRAPFVTFLHQLCSFSTWKWTKVTYLWISAARPQCNCEPALDGTRVSSRPWEDQVGGKDRGTEWWTCLSASHRKTIGGEGASFFLQFCGYIFMGIECANFELLDLNALWIKTICSQAKDWSFLWQNHVLMWKVGYDESWEYFGAFCDFLLNPTFKLMGGS